MFSFAYYSSSKVWKGTIRWKNTSNILHTINIIWHASIDAILKCKLLTVLYYNKLYDKLWVNKMFSNN